MDSLLNLNLQEETSEMELETSKTEPEIEVVRTLNSTMRQHRGQSIQLRQVKASKEKTEAIAEKNDNHFVIKLSELICCVLLLFCYYLYICAS